MQGLELKRSIRLTETYWEELLERPLDEVRALLRLPQAPRYRAAEPIAKRIEVEFQVQRELSLSLQKDPASA